MHSRVRLFLCQTGLFALCSCVHAVYNVPNAERISPIGWHLFMITRRRRFLLVLFIWTLLCVLYAGSILLGRERIQTGDFTGQFHAFTLFQARELAQGRLPIWSGGSYAGFPFIGDIQSASVYLPRWLTLGVVLAGAPSLYTLQLEAFAHVWLLGVFLCLLVTDLTGRPFAGLVSAIAFGLGGYVTSYPLLQLAVLQTVTWAPFCLWLIWRGIRAPSPGPWLLGAGLALAMAGTAGHPQTWMQIVYLCAAFFLHQSLGARWRWSWIAAMGAILGLTALGASAGAWLPAGHYMRFTTRAAVDYRFVASGLPLLDYIQLWVPGVRSLWSPQYVGLGALLLVTAAWRGRHDVPDKARAEISFWAGVVVVAGLLSLGDKGILFELGYRFLPGMMLFRQQERWAGLVALALAVLAGYGCAMWLDLPSHRWRPHLRHAAAWILAAIVILAVTLTVAVAADMRFGWQLYLIQLALLAAMSLLLWLPRRSSAATIGLCALLLAIMGADLFRLAELHREPGSPHDVWPTPAWLDEVTHSAPQRLDITGFGHANLGEAYGIDTISGISPLRPVRLQALLDLPEERVWQLLGVGQVLRPTHASIDGLDPIMELPAGSVPGQHGPAMLYRVPDPMPRVWVSHDAQVVASDAEALALLSDPHIDLAQVVLLHETIPTSEPNPMAGSSTHMAASAVRWLQVTSGAMDVHVALGDPGWLVIGEWHHPGWRATLNGEPTPLLRANYGLQALALPAGEHIVRVRYAPTDFWLGLGLMALSWLLAAWGIWRWRPLPSLAEAALASASFHPLPIGYRRFAAWATSSGALIGLTVGALLLRLYRLGYQELRGDEAFSYLYARLPVREIVAAILAEGDPHPPLHYVLLRANMLLLGDGEWALRIPSAIAGALLVPVLWYLGRRLYDARFGALLALFGAISQGLVWLGQDARSQYMLAPLLGTVATLQLLRAVERPSWRRWGWYVLFCVLTVYSLYYGALILVAHSAYCLAHPKRKKLLAPWALCGGVALLLFMPWFMVAGPRTVSMGHLAAPGEPELAGFLNEVGSWLTLGTGWVRVPRRFLWLFGGILAVLGGRALLARERSKEQRAAGAMIIVWVSLAAWAIFLVQFRRETFNAYYMVIAAPAWWALVANGVLALRAKRQGLVRAGLALALLLLANGHSLVRHYHDPEQSKSNGYRQAAALLASESQPNDLFVANFPDPCWDYYLRNLDIQRTMVPRRAQQDVDTVAETLGALMHDHSRLWFVPLRAASWDAEGATEHWLEYNTLREGRWLLRHLDVRAYRPEWTALDAMQSLDIGFGEGVRLRGSLLALDGHPISGANPISVPAGSTLALSLAWEASDTLATSYVAFVHLLDAQGHLVSQHDGIPVFGTRPTTVWQPGEIILDRHELDVSQEVIDGRLIVGLYDAQTVVRLPSSTGQDAMEIVAITAAGGSAAK